MPHRVINDIRPHQTWGSHRAELADALEGLILWLPQLNDLPRQAQIGKGCYGHPVVVLSPRALPSDDVVVLILTSFGERDVNDKFFSVELRRAYLPIYPAQNQDTDIQVYLQDGAQLRKKSYVNTREQHTLPLSCLRPYDRKDSMARYVLTRDSSQILARHAGFVFNATGSLDDYQTAGAHDYDIYDYDAHKSGSHNYYTGDYSSHNYGTAPVIHRFPSLPSRPSPPPSVAHDATHDMFSYESDDSYTAPPANRPRPRHFHLPFAAQCYIYHDATDKYEVYDYYEDELNGRPLPCAALPLSKAGVDDPQHHDHHATPPSTRAHQPTDPLPPPHHAGADSSEGNWDPEQGEWERWFIQLVLSVAILCSVEWLVRSAWPHRDHALEIVLGLSAEAAKGGLSVVCVVVELLTEAVKTGWWLVWTMLWLHMEVAKFGLLGALWLLAEATKGGLVVVWIVL